MTVLMKSCRWDKPGAAGYDEIEWNLWKVRQWPYLNLAEGDHYFAVTRGGLDKGTVKSECEIEYLVLAHYSTLKEAWDLIRTGIPASVRKELDQLRQSRDFLLQEYTAGKPSSGYLLAFVSRNVRDINQPRPKGFKFRRNGWGSYDGPTW